MFFLPALLLLIVLPAPWNVIGGIASVALGVFEVAYWRRRMQREKIQTGVENLVGSTGEVTELLAPSGQIRVLGELWQARSSSELPPGSRVRVVAVRGLTLEVETAGPTDERDLAPYCSMTGNGDRAVASQLAGRADSVPAPNHPLRMMGPWGYSSIIAPHSAA